MLLRERPVLGTCRADDVMKRPSVAMRYQALASSPGRSRKPLRFYGLSNTFVSEHVQFSPSVGGVRGLSDRAKDGRLFVISEAHAPMFEVGTRAERFASALIAPGPSDEIPPEHRIFAPLIGSWQLLVEWFDED